MGVARQGPVLADICRSSAKIVKGGGGPSTKKGV